jgi:hypothetical protein
MLDNLPGWLKAAISLIIVLGTGTAYLLNLDFPDPRDPASPPEEVQPPKPPQAQTQTIRISVRDRYTKEKIPDVQVELEVSVGTNQEGLTDTNGEFIFDIPTQERVRLYLRKEGYLREDRWIDLKNSRVEPEKFNYLLIPEDNEGVPPIDGGNNPISPVDYTAGEYFPEFAANPDGPKDDKNPNQNSRFDADQATQKIDEWLKAKANIFADPYDTDLARRFLAGQMLEENLGSANWLRTYKWNYYYEDSRVMRDSNGAPIYHNSFVVDYDKRSASMLVSVYEKRTLIKKNGSTCKKQSGESTQDFRYVFSLDTDSQDWKMSFFCPIDEYENCLPIEQGC